MSARAPLMVPVCVRTGEMRSYAEPYRLKPEADEYWREEMRPADELRMAGSLKFKCFARGRSAAHAIFEEPATGKTYPMFLVDLAAAIPRMREGWLEGTWEPCKKGCNYAWRCLPFMEV